MSQYATTLRRAMAEHGMTLRQVVSATGLHERTVKAVLRGGSKPHARTLHQLACGLKLEVREFFPAPDNSAAMDLSPSDRKVFEQVAIALQSDYRELLLGTIELIMKQMAADGAPYRG